VMNVTERGEMETGNVIRKARKARNWTQKQLAEKVFTSRENVSRWEGGKQLPRRIFRRHIEEILGVSLEEK